MSNFVFSNLNYANCDVFNIYFLLFYKNISPSFKIKIG